MRHAALAGIRRVAPLCQLSGGRGARCAGPIGRRIAPRWPGRAHRQRQRGQGPLAGLVLAHLGCAGSGGASGADPRPRWECPDLFPLPLDGDAARPKWVFAKGSGDYIVGSFDGQRFTPEVGPIRTHWGGSFYGAQTFSDAPGGRRVQIAWMNTGKEAGPNSWPGMPFNQQMSFPRELTLRSTPEGPRLLRQPIAEIVQLYVGGRAQCPRRLEPGANALADVAGELLDIQLELELRQATEVKLRLRGVEIVYDVKAAKLRLFGRALDLVPKDGKLALRVLLDRTSVEVFANHGDMTFSGVFFPAASDREYFLA